MEREGVKVFPAYLVEDILVDVFESINSEVAYV
jgi:hypothetical protein